ncbi:MAG: hypothetical protein IJ751_02570 [Oscillospiraceae bacterium]|nr:hypothetical protein [Oscillospiraceae bacterium]
MVFRSRQTWFKLIFAACMSVIMPTATLLYTGAMGLYPLLSGFCCSFFITVAILNTLDMALPGRRLAAAVHRSEGVAGFVITNGVTGFLMAFVMNFCMAAVQTGFDPAAFPRQMFLSLPAAIPASTLGCIVSTWFAQTLANRLPE